MKKSVEANKGKLLMFLEYFFRRENIDGKRIIQMKTCFTLFRIKLFIIE